MVHLICLLQPQARKCTKPYSYDLGAPTGASDQKTHPFYSTGYAPAARQSFADTFMKINKLFDEMQ